MFNSSPNDQSLEKSLADVVHYPGRLIEYTAFDSENRFGIVRQIVPDEYVVIEDVITKSRVSVVVVSFKNDKFRFRLARPEEIFGHRPVHNKNHYYRGHLLHVPALRNHLTKNANNN
jgi:hypothetical protein